MARIASKKTNWMKNVKSNGATRARLKVKKGEKVTITQLNADIAKQRKKRQKNGKLPAAALKAIRQDIAAKNMMKSNTRRQRKK